MAAQRSVATSSVASKKQVEEAKAVKEAAEADLAAQAEAARAAEEQKENVASESNGADMGAPRAADWEDERLDENSALQSLVDRLHDKGEKEVNRIIKVCLRQIYRSLKM
jgi:ATP-dependent RNA helicase DHX29